MKKWFDIAQKLSILQALLNHRASGKTWTLANGVNNNKHGAVVLVGDMSIGKYIKEEILNPRVKIVSWDSDLDSLRAINMPIAVEHTAVSAIITDFFRMTEGLREENELLKAEVHSYKEREKEFKDEQSRKNSPHKRISR